MSKEKIPRIFFDTNVFIEGLRKNFSPPRAILIMARFGVFRLVLSPTVNEETKKVLLHSWDRGYKDRYIYALPPEADKGESQLIDEYEKFLHLSNPEWVESATTDEISEYTSYIHHVNDIPVLVEAMKAQPDWFITANTKHFDEEVASRTKLRIINQFDFLRLWHIPESTYYDSIRDENQRSRIII